MNTFTYKGYNGTVEVDPKEGILFGHVLDLDTVLTVSRKPSATRNKPSARRWMSTSIGAPNAVSGRKAVLR